MRFVKSLLRVATTVRHGAGASASMSSATGLNTLIFDIDDTLYPVSARFSEHRNGPVVAKFMCEQLGFESEKEALALRDEMFKEHHSTLKGLAVASAAGRTPKPFEEKSLGEYLRRPVMDVAVESTLKRVASGRWK